MFRHLAILLAAAALVAGGVIASMALAGNPHGAPPGQDPCSHGVTGKPCKPDPQPEHGKDCEDHGNYGGVNEDHCTPTVTTTTGTTPTDTTPTTTVPTTTTPTTPTPPRCPPGQGPFAGKDGQPGNDECCPDSDNNQQCDTPPAASTNPTRAQPPTSSVGPLSTTTSAATASTPPTAKSKVRTSTTHKTLKTKPAPKLTGNPKQDKCKDLGNGTMNCKGIVVTQGSG